VAEIPRDAIQALLPLIAQRPNGRLEVLPGAGHLSNLEAPAEFNRALESFLSGL
jgi:pimeloyl-ACP methyl ester carboxylesterase